MKGIPFVLVIKEHNITNIVQGAELGHMCHDQEYEGCTDLVQANSKPALSDLCTPHIS